MMYRKSLKCFVTYEKLQKAAFPQSLWSQWNCKCINCLAELGIFTLRAVLSWILCLVFCCSAFSEILKQLEKGGWMNEFCDENDLYRTTFLVKKREKKCVFQWTPSKEIQEKVFKLYMWWPIVYYWSRLFFLLYNYLLEIFFPAKSNMLYYIWKHVAFDVN